MFEFIFVVVNIEFMIANRELFGCLFEIHVYKFNSLRLHLQT